MAPRHRRLLPVLLTATALSVAACGGGGDSTQSASEQHATITVWSWVKGLKAVVDEFNRTHQDVHVDYSEIPSGNAGGYAKLTQALKAGNAPDVATIEYPQLPGYVADGSVQDITGKVTDFDKTFTGAARGLVTLDGKQWAVPFDVSPMVLYYRKDLFAKYDLAVPKTWDEYAADAAAVQKADPAVKLADFNVQEGAPILAGLSWQAGGRWFKVEGDTWHVGINDSASQKVAGYWQDLLAKGTIGVTANSQQYVQELTAGTVLSHLGAAWSAGSTIQANLPKEAGQWAVAPLPSWDGKPASAGYGGSTFAVTKDSKHQAADLTFITWLTTSPDAVKARGVAGSTYPAATALVGPAKQTYLKDNTFWGSEDIYAQFDAAAASTSSDWTWGPAMNQTLSTLKDALAKAPASGTIGQALQSTQDSTVSAIRGSGLKVAG
jgi:multiple sugar transport system substrate-binding protein